MTQSLRDFLDALHQRADGSSTVACSPSSKSSARSPPGCPLLRSFREQSDGDWHNALDPFVLNRAAGHQRVFCNEDAVKLSQNFRVGSMSIKEMRSALRRTVCARSLQHLHLDEF